MIPASKTQTPDEVFVDDLKPGTTLLHGQYTIRRYLNAGGFGITYLAADSLDRTVVIKECFPSAFCRRSNLVVQARSRAFQNELGTIVQLFLKEARSLSKLSHPNIVGVHQVFEGNNTAYMALDFIKGEDLFNLIERRDPRLTPATIRTMLEKLLDAIGAVHGAGLLHRDISPDNILVTEEMEPTLIDFGAAREQATRKTRALSALRIVKDGYSPQEFYIAGSEQGPASDLYSLAATFYHLITGEPPPNSQVRIAAQVEGKPDPYVPLRKQTSAFDPAFCDALDRAIAILPRSRFQSAHEWRAALAANGGPVPGSYRPSVISTPVSVPHFQRFPAPDQPPQVQPTQMPGPAARKGGPRALALTVGGGAVAVALVAGLVLTGSGAVGSEGLRPPASLASTQAAAPDNPAPQTDKAEVALVLQSVMDGQASYATAGPAGSVGAAAAMPGFVPEPVIVARDGVSGLGVVTRSWSFDLPFTTVAFDDLTLASATGAAAAGLMPGHRIVAVDGQAVSDLAEVAALIQAAGSQSEGDRIRFELSLAPAVEGPGLTQPVEVMRLPSVEFPNGLSLRSRYSGGVWVTEIASAPEDAGSGLRAGDILIALMPSREPVGHVDVLRDLIMRDLAAGKTTFSFAIRRDGLMWVEDLTIRARAG